MKRVGILVLVGAVAVGAAMAAAARWAPAALQPAGARTELSRLMVQGVEELDSMLGDWSGDGDIGEAPVQHASVDTDEVAETAAASETPTHCAAPVYRTLSSFGGTTNVTTGVTAQNCRVHVVTLKGAEGWRMESRWVCRESLKKS